MNQVVRSELNVGLCVVYGAIAALALMGCFYQNWPYYQTLPFQSFLDFVRDAMVTGAARSVSWDISMMCIVCFIFMFREKRKYPIRFMWAYVLMTVFIALALAFPLFLMEREIARSKVLQ